MKCTIEACNDLRRGKDYCAKHYARNRVHGHPLQEIIPPDALRPHLDTARQIATSGVAWKEAERAWATLAANCKAKAEEFERGHLVRWTLEHTVNFEVAQIARKAADGAVVQTVVAMYLLAREESKRFKSNTGFCFQLVCHLRKLDGVESKPTWQPEIVETMSTLVIGCMGGAAVRITGGQLRRSAKY